MDGQKCRFLSHFDVKLSVLVLLFGVLAGGVSAFGEAMGKASVEPSELTVSPPTVSPPTVSPSATSTLGGGPRLSVSAPVAAPTVAAPTRQAEVAPVAPAVVADKVVKEDEEWASKPAVVEEFKPAIPAEAFKDPIEGTFISGDKGTAAASDNDTTTTTATSGGGGVLPGLPEMVKVGSALLAVLGLVFLLKGAARKFVPGAQGGSGKGVIEVLARHPLSKNQALVLVRIGSQIVAINQGRDESQSMLVISEPTEVAKIMGQIEGTNPKSMQSGFTSLLANARMDLERSNEDAYEPQALEGLGRRTLGPRSVTPPSVEPEDLDSQLDEMAAAKRQLMQLRQQVRSVRDSIPR